MTGTQLFDQLSNGGNFRHHEPSEAEELRELGEGMVAAAIASGKMLREHQARMFPSDDSPAAMAVAKTLQAEFRQWVGEADAVYQRALTLHRAGSAIANVAELDDLIGRTQAMLQVSPENHLRSLKEVGNARAMTMEELRRELHAERADFQVSLGALPPWLQEETLDELEFLLANPKKLIVRPGNDLAFYDFVRIGSGRVHYIFLGIRPDHAVSLLELVSLGHLERP